MVHAAMADEESVNRLAASLKANVPAWNGNTDAIERHIKSAQRLGFEDETLRDSLTILVGATHDVGKAEAIMATAMDLARFKGIDLRTASEALIKVEGGHYRALAQLGIKLKDGATQTEALAAVQAVAAGQAEAYAKTNSGKLLASQIAVNEALESAGRTLLPIVAEGLNTLTYALDRTLLPLDKLKDAAAHGVGPARLDLERLTKAAEANQVSIEDLYAAWSGSGQSIEEAAKHLGAEVDHQLDGMADRGADTSRRMAGAAAVISGAYALFEAKSKEATRHVQDDAAAMDRAIQHLKTDALTAATDTVTGYYDVIINEDKLAAENAEISAAKRVLASKTATDAEKRDARSALHQAEADRAETIATLAGAGATQSKAFTHTMAGLYAQLKTAHGAEKAAIEAEIRRLQLLAVAAAIANGKVLTLEQSIIATLAKGGYISAAGSITPPKPKPTPKPPPPKTNTGARAGGGPVGPGFHGTVGEAGIERLDIDDSGEGYVTPMTPGSHATGASSVGGTYNFNFNVSAGAWSPGQAEQWARQVTPHIAREFQRQGLIAR